MQNITRIIVYVVGLINCAIPAPEINPIGCQIVCYDYHEEIQRLESRYNNPDNHWGLLSKPIKCQILEYVVVYQPSKYCIISTTTESIPFKLPEPIKIFWHSRGTGHIMEMCMKNFRFEFKLIDPPNREHCLQNPYQFCKLKIPSVGPPSKSEEYLGINSSILIDFSVSGRPSWIDVPFTIQASHNLEHLPDQTLPLLETILALHYGLQTIIGAYPNYADSYGTPNSRPLLIQIHAQFVTYLKGTKLLYPNLRFLVSF